MVLNPNKEPIHFLNVFLTGPGESGRKTFKIETQMTIKIVVYKG